MELVHAARSRLRESRESRALFSRREAIGFAIEFADFDETAAAWIDARYALAQRLGVTGLSSAAFEADLSERRANHDLQPPTRPAADTLRILITDQHRVMHSVDWKGAAILAASSVGAKYFADIGATWVRKQLAARRRSVAYVEIFGPDGRLLKRVRVKESRRRLSVRRMRRRRSRQKTR